MPTTFRTTKKKKIHIQQKEVKGIKINLDLIFNYFPVHRTGLRLVRNNKGDKGSPCLKPQELGKKPLRLPFTKIEKRTVEMQA